MSMQFITKLGMKTVDIYEGDAEKEFQLIFPIKGFIWKWKKMSCVQINEKGTNLTTMIHNVDP